MSQKPQILYLHGLGSGPRSQKGVLVHDYFSALGCSVALPSISVPSLEALSPRKAVEAVQEEVSSRALNPLILVGSSFGGFIALHALNELAEHKRAHVAKLVLLAPALDPWDPGSQLLSPERERLWRDHGSAPILDIERGIEVPVHYGFVEELRGFDSWRVELPVPTLIIHGRDDEVVSVGQSQRFAVGRPWVTLEVVHDTHQLLKNPQKLLESVNRFVFFDSTSSR